MKKLLFITSGILIALSGCDNASLPKDHHDEYAEVINNHPYSKRPHLTPEDLKKIPKKDRPDLAMEQDFLLTMDPALGRPAPERLLPVYQQISDARKHPVPGIPGSANSPWVERGPNNVGGRTRAIMFDPNDPSHKKVWAGGVTGGLWYNNDITSSSSIWTAVDDFWDNISITAIAADPTDDSTFYVSTGEHWGSSVSGARGAGIWKSTDAGSTWSQLSATSNYPFINDLEVREENGVGVIYAGLRGLFYMGIVHGAGTEGLQRSTDGGQTFTQVLPNVPSQSYNYAVGDIEIDASNRIWVGTIRSANGSGSRGGGTILYSDNGTSWTTAYTNNQGRRVKLATAPSDSAYVYAIVEEAGEVGEMIKTTDRGLNWTNITEPSDADPGIPGSDFSRSQAWIHLALSVDPNDENTLLAGGIDLFRSDNGGLSWDQLSHWYGGFGFTEVHADQQIIAYRPGSSSEALFGNDGGVYRSTNLTANTPSFSNLNRGYNVTQFYSCAIHPNAGSNYFLGGTQDNGSHQFLSAGVNATTEVSGGDGAYCFIDQTNPQIQVTSYVYNSFWLSSDGGANFSNRIQNDNTGSFINPADYDDNLHILYSARTTSSINRIVDMNSSPSVTFFSAFIGSMASHLRVSPYTTTSTTLFVGTQAGRVYKITDADGASPNTNNISTGLPAGSVSCIEIGASEDELLVTYSNYGVNSVWYTNDGGSNWTSIEGNLPDMPVRWALFNPNDRTEAILATEVGVWSCDDISASSPVWIPSTSGLANVRTSMLQMRSSDNEVIAATFGRGIFSSNGFEPASVPTASFTSPASPICGNDTLTFSDQSTGSPSSWQWTFTPNTVSFANGTSANAPNPQVVFNTSGNYTVKLKVTNSLGTDSMSTNVFAGVFTPPAISALGNQLYCSSTEPGLTYQWYENGSLIAGANGDVINITNNATYRVTVSVGGCSMTSPDFTLGNISLSETDLNEQINVYPNPVRDIVNIQFLGTSFKPDYVEITSLQGKSVLRSEVSTENNLYTINISNLPAGHYILNLVSSKTVISKKLEKL